MSIGNQNTTFANVGQTFDFPKNKYGVLTSVLLTTSDFECLETDLQDEDTMFGHFQDGNIFPLHNVHVSESTVKQPNRTESIQDFSYETYPGKDIYSIKYDWRPDYHQLISQFNGQELRVIFGFNNKYYLTTQNGSNVMGFKLSNIKLNDIEIIGTNLSPLLLELGDKQERKSEVYTNAGYKLSDIDRRFISFDISATSTEINFTAYFLGNEVTNIISSDVTVTDDANGELTFNFAYYGLGYLLNSFSDTFTRGCLSVLSEGYIGRTRYVVEAVVPYDNFVFMSGDNFVFMSGDNFIFH